MKKNIKNFKEFLNENIDDYYLDDMEGEYNPYENDNDDIDVMEPETDEDEDFEPSEYINPDIDQEDEDIEIDNRINMFKKEGIPSEFWSENYEEEDAELEESKSWRKVTEKIEQDTEEFYNEDEYLTDEERQLLRGTEDNPEGL